ncbi:MAG: hypothetical protein U1F43_11700 [Myxococcota bacterium]
MPAKLILVIVFLAMSIAMNLITESWVAAGLSGLLLYSLVRGSHTARSIAIGLSVLGLVVAGILTIQVAIRSGFAYAPFTLSVTLGIGLANGVYTIWALTRPDVPLDGRAPRRRGRRELARPAPRRLTSLRPRPASRPAPARRW